MAERPNIPARSRAFPGGQRYGAGKRTGCAGFALAVLLLTGCGPALVQAPTQPLDDAAFAEPATVVLPGLPNDAPSPYVVLPGDILHLRTTSVDPIDIPDAEVDPTGKLHVPLAGEIEVGGLPLGAAEKRIEEALHPHDRFARVMLSVTKPSGQRATLLGAVSRPGMFEIRPNLRIAELMAQAGGLKTVEAEGESIEMADLDGARLVREGAALPVSFSRALEGDPLHNVRLRAGDLLFVPPARGRRVVVLGEVRSPKVVPFRRGIRLSEVLAMAGGATKDADGADVRVIRGPLSAPRVYRADLKALVAGRAGDVELAPGDVVFVTEHWFATATQLVNRLTPTLAATAVVATLLKP